MSESWTCESRRRLLIGSGASLLGAAFGRSAFAATTAPALPLAQIIDRNIAARGGAAAWRAVQTLSMSGLLDAGRVSADARKLIEETRKAPGRPRKRLHPEVTQAEAESNAVIRLPYLIEFKRPHKMRVELKVRDMTAIQVYDGTQGWKLRPFLGRREVEPYSADELKIASRQQELDGPLINYAAKGTRVEAAGIESVAGRDAYKLQLTLKSGDVMHLWVDAQTFLDAKIETSRTFGGKQRAVATYMRDYRKVDGLMLPFQLEDQVEGARVTERIDVQQVSVNPPIADTHFAIDLKRDDPRAGKPL